ncbi:MAG: hypothetical protein FD165_1299 [Gammaproteobacteria bacterium]|nr:MAG: hypothetical protein FD165_1299 [Gammaproteobacteria bacterium]TND05798.1 MAG: hypothetical protein FD120_1011 [Gammaproteobacteria bacterium]
MVLRSWHAAAASLMLVLAPAVFASDIAYFQQLLLAAEARGLAQHPDWHALLHYRKNLAGSSVTSEADDPAFFAAPDGKTNPAAELAATLRIFFSTEQAGDQQLPQCRFIARYHWLKEQLGFDSSRLPEQSCRRFDEWYAALNPQGLTLVFPVSYLNNPASMFGHTLLRVDAQNQTEQTRLLAYAVNYAALVGNENGIAFAVKGLIGSYAGLFSVLPYYLKVREYNDIDNRDIWEYELNFTADETHRLLTHLWELRGIRFDYFFFDENCSYHLLSLFDVARPGLQLANRFVWWAIPADTVRAVVAEQGMVKNVVYRPAASTRLLARLDGMSGEHRQLALDIADSVVPATDQALAGLPDDERAAVIELSDEYLRYEVSARKRPQGDVAALMQQLLVARSAIDVEYAPVRPDVPGVRPDQGHRTRRADVGAGTTDHQAYQELAIRPAYHDLLDADGGYQRGAEIRFFDLTLRFNDHANTLRLEDFTPVGIVSLTPRNRFTKSVSWVVAGHVTRSRLAPGVEPLIFRLDGGAGLSATTNHGALWYGLFASSLDVSGHLDKDFALGAGPDLGVLWTHTARLKTQLSARALRYALGDAHTRAEAGIWQNVSFSESGALRYGMVRHREFDHYWTESRIAWQMYF